MPRGRETNNRAGSALTQLVKLSFAENEKTFWVIGAAKRISGESRIISAAFFLPDFCHFLLRDTRLDQRHQSLLWPHHYFSY